MQPHQSERSRSELRKRPLVVGIGGTTVAGSSTESALRLALAAAASAGAEVRLFGGPYLAALPHYQPGAGEHSSARELIASVRAADGLLLASPGYHGSISGLVKNAIDFFEEMARDERVYLDGIPVGLIVTAYGWQATGSTLAALRSIVHSLRGWPTPFGAALNVSGRPFIDGVCQDAVTRQQLETVGRQVVSFAPTVQAAITVAALPALTHIGPTPAMAS